VHRALSALLSALVLGRSVAAAVRGAAGMAITVSVLASSPLPSLLVRVVAEVPPRAAADGTSSAVGAPSAPPVETPAAAALVSAAAAAGGAGAPPPSNAAAGVADLLRVSREHAR